MSETFNLIIDPSSLPNGVTSSNNATVTILDQDGEGGDLHFLYVTCVCLLTAVVHVMFAQSAYTVKEGEEVSIGLTLSNPSSTDITLTISTSGGNATGMSLIPCTVSSCHIM